MAQVKIAVGKRWQFWYSDYILQSIEMGRGVSEVRSLKALLIYKNGCS